MTQVAAGQSLIRIVVTPSGETTITIEPPALPAARGHSFFHGEMLTCINPCGLPVIGGETAEAPYFSDEEEAVIEKLQAEMSLSREQLLGHLMHDLLADALSRFASRHGAG